MGTSKEKNEERDISMKRENNKREIAGWKRRKIAEQKGGKKEERIEIRKTELNENRRKE